jgi:hypothetical protein
MKTIFLILVMVIMVGTLNAVQPARKPFIKMKIDGTLLKTGDVLTVTRGQKLKLELEMEGGRRDFCKFPDSYADITGTAQILSRGDNGLTYLLNDKKAEWKLLSENVQFATDDFVKIVDSGKPSTAEIHISNEKFSQSFLKATIKAIWQFSNNDTTRKEENIAVASVYLKIAGASDEWYFSQNIKVSGIKNELVQEKLIAVQSACDSIEKDLNQLNFSAVQQAIRDLQTATNDLKSTIDELKASNPSYQIKVLFTGLPSDQPYRDINLFSSIKISWSTLEPFLNEQKLELGKLPEQPSDESKKELVKIIGKYTDWQASLPDKTFEHLLQYIPSLNIDSIRIPEKFELIAKEKTLADYTQTMNDFNALIDQRIKMITAETQEINSTSTRIQAIRLFDGMLRSFFASINWAEWISSRK